MCILVNEEALEQVANKSRRSNRIGNKTRAQTVKSTRNNKKKEAAESAPDKQRSGGMEQHADGIEKRADWLDKGGKNQLDSDIYFWPFFARISWALPLPSFRSG